MKLSLELKIKDKVIKLTEEEARELGETLATMFDLKRREYIPQYPIIYRDYWPYRIWYDTTTTWTVDNNTTYCVANISDDVTATYQLTGS